MSTTSWIPYFDRNPNLLRQSSNIPLKLNSFFFFFVTIFLNIFSLLWIINSRTQKHFFNFRIIGRLFCSNGFSACRIYPALSQKGLSLRIKCDLSFKNNEIFSQILSSRSYSSLLYLSLCGKFDHIPSKLIPVNIILGIVHEANRISKTSFKKNFNIPWANMNIPNSIQHL